MNRVAYTRAAREKAPLIWLVFWFLPFNSIKDSSQGDGAAHSGGVALFVNPLEMLSNA